MTNEEKNKILQERIVFNKILATIINRQIDLSKPIYVIARFWLNEFQGIEMFTDYGNNDLNDIKDTFQRKYAWKDDKFGITKVSYKLIRVDLTQILNSKGEEVKENA